MELDAFEALLDAKLKPMQDTVIRIERAMEQLIEVQKMQARQDEQISRIRHDVDVCLEKHGESGTRMWDVIKIIVTAALSALAGGAVVKGIGK